MESQKAVTFETVLTSVKQLSLVDQVRLIEWIAPRIKQKLTTEPPTEPPTASPTPPRQAQFGSAKGSIVMADDFDAPLEDFEDYMP
jgi:hypothetical protein